MAELYKKIIWQHYHHPQNQGRLKSPDHKFSGANPYCGDKVTFFIKLDKSKKIKEVAWEGEGCAVSRAAASIFSQMIKNKTLAQAKKISQEKFINELHEEFSPTRLKCALLPLYTLREEEIE